MSDSPDRPNSSVGEDAAHGPPSVSDVASSPTPCKEDVSMDGRTIKQSDTQTANTAVPCETDLSNHYQYEPAFFFPATKLSSSEIREKDIWYVGHGKFLVPESPMGRTFFPERQLNCREKGELEIEVWDVGGGNFDVKTNASVPDSYQNFADWKALLTHEQIENLKHETQGDSTIGAVEARDNHSAAD